MVLGVRIIFSSPILSTPSRTSTQTSQKLTDCSIHYSD